MQEYLESILPLREGILKELQEYAHSFNVPIIRNDSASLLEVLVKLHKPIRVLEAGTAIGYSAILMANAGAKGIDTVEIDLNSVIIARENIKKAGLENVIKVIPGDATEVFSCLTKTYDMIFVDAAKGQYLQMYDDILRLLKPGGLLVCDNVIFYGKIYQTPESAPHKHRTIIANMRAFLEKLFADTRLTSSILESGDGMTVSIKEKN